MLQLRKKINAVARVVKVWNRWLWPLATRLRVQTGRGAGQDPRPVERELSSCCRTCRPFSASNQVRKHTEPQAKPVFQSLPKCAFCGGYDRGGFAPKGQNAR
uniref:Uncharacterized protein n=1 Tax=Capra hircus TaxID=9925 RepID=A0A8C2N961_CAPHI